MQRPQLLLALALAAATTLAGCTEDQQLREIAGPDLSNGLFDRYVALGNSITAGFQSAGIVDSTQLQAYPVLLAQQAGVGARFNVPQLAFPGCPPPLVAPIVVSSARLGGASAPPCSLRETPAPNLVNNLAVPGAKIASALDFTVAANVLTTLILGGRTPVQAMIDAQPTFVTVWLGNNDVLGAAQAGDTTLLTPLADFNASLGQIAGAITQTPAADAAVLIGISPFPAVVQPGAYFFALGQAGQLPKPVSPNCSPVTATGQPNPLAANLVSLGALTSPEVAEISCADDAPFLLNQAELQVFFGRVLAYNAATRAAADANGWLYFDPNTAIAGPTANAANFRLVADPAQFRLCQGLATATLATFQQAVATTCPGPDGDGDVTNFFGTYLTFDSVHPSAAYHQAIANALATAINDFYGTKIATG
jgi:lysophospholipase L1-like esterase